MTKSHTTKIVAGSYCTKMSVISVKSSSFVRHVVLLLYSTECAFDICVGGREEHTNVRSAGFIVVTHHSYTAEMVGW